MTFVEALRAQLLLADAAYGCFAFWNIDNPIATLLGTKFKFRVLGYKSEPFYLFILDFGLLRQLLIELCGLINFDFAAFIRTVDNLKVFNLQGQILIGTVLTIDMLTTTNFDFIFGINEADFADRFIFFCNFVSNPGKQLFKPHWGYWLQDNYF